MRNKMRTPAVAQIFDQNMTYKCHLKKLDHIREQRKNHLAYDHQRMAQFQNIKQTKSHSFAHKFTSQNREISQSNTKFFVKLESVKPLRHLSYSSVSSDGDKERFITPFVKNKIIETEKENSRIFMKMKMISSSLKKEKLLKQFAKTEIIKARITKYAIQNNKVTLKSQKYASLSSSVMSNRTDHWEKDSTKAKKSLATHYLRNQILKNKIENLPKGTKSNKPFNCSRLQQLKMEDKAFFTTQPLKQNKHRQIPKKQVLA